MATWVKQTLTENIQRVVLSSEAMRKPSPPGRMQAYLPDGSNLPWVVAELEKKDPGRHQEWIEHLRQTLPDIVSATTRERPEDRHRYLVLTYQNGLEAPSWLVSDGTLRFLAVTLLAHIRGLTGIYLVEEPENGVHPRVVEAVFQSLSSVYDAQVLVATHSPVAVNSSKLEHLLCISRDASGATDLVSGDRHPRLQQWKERAVLLLGVPRRGRRARGGGLRRLRAGRVLRCKSSPNLHQHAGAPVTHPG